MDEASESREGRGPDATHVEQILHAAKTTTDLSGRHDALGEFGSDSGQENQICSLRLIEVESLAVAQCSHRGAGQRLRSQ